MKTKMAILAALVASTAFAGPADKLEPVADGFPDWQGLTPKNYMGGRVSVSPSDLRHKVTIVVDIEPNEKMLSQMKEIAAIFMANKAYTMRPESQLEDWKPPRNVIGVVSHWGANHKAFEAALASAKNDPDVARLMAVFRGFGCCIFDNVTFTGAPDSTGKRPYVYVMGPSGKEPLWQGELNAAAKKGVSTAVAKGLKEIQGWESPWRPFYGNIAEPKFHPQLTKAMEKAKTAKSVPIDPIAKTILANVKSKDEEKAREAQILYDAIVQTRNDMVLRLSILASKTPHLAAAELPEFFKFWPGEKKNMSDVVDKIRQFPESEHLAKLYVKLKTWSDPEFTCKNAAEAKKIVAELTKSKKALEKLKGSKVITVQDAASLLEMKIDDLITSIPSRVAEK